MNIIFCSYAYLESYISTIEKSSNLVSNEKINMYLRCSVVSLISLRNNNPDCEIALVTNIKIPNNFEDIFNKNNIKVIRQKFDLFTFDSEMKWSLAFYKLCALDHIVNDFSYDKIMTVDLDVFCSKNLNEVWIEADTNLLLYDMHHSLSNQQSINMNNEYYQLYDKHVILPNYGGEFICGNRKYLKMFLDECHIIYRRMIEKNIRTNHGDEFIICSVSIRMREIIKNANAYVFRYWTDKFYLVSTNYYYNPVSLLHLPDEKKRGFKKMYYYYLKKQKLLDNDKAIKLFGLPKLYRTLRLNDYIYLAKKVIIKILAK